EAIRIHERLQGSTTAAGEALDGARPTPGVAIRMGQADSVLRAGCGERELAQPGDLTLRLVCQRAQHVAVQGATRLPLNPPTSPAAAHSPTVCWALISAAVKGSTPICWLSSKERFVSACRSTRRSARSSCVRAFRTKMSRKKRVTSTAADSGV